MTKLNEISPPNSQQSGALRDGLEALDLDQITEFQGYTRVVLPLDGYIFWSPRAKFQFKGALHFAQDILQNEDETYGAASLTFTSEKQITEFTSAPINTIYVASLPDGTRYAFSAHTGFFQQASLWHYSGHSIAPAMETQFLDRPDWNIDADQAVVSNSMPLWLALNNFTSLFYGGFSNTGVPFVVKPPILYPADIVSPNEFPPYGSVKIPDDYPKGLQAVPLLDRRRSHYQLVTDQVRITLYGLQNDACLDFVDTVNQYSLVTDNFGIMGEPPVIRDVTRTQAEIQAKAMKKQIVFNISYYQKRVADVARQLILSAPYQFILASNAQ